jgi:hypothetical protein
MLFYLAELFTLKMEVLSSSETLVLPRVTRRHIPEDGILDSCYCLNNVRLSVSSLLTRASSLILFAPDSPATREK